MAGKWQVNAQGKSSRTSLAASTFAGELRSGTSCDRREMTDINCSDQRHW